MNIEDVIDVLQKHRESLQKHSVKRIGIFGSLVRGEQDENSDIDILVEFYRKSFDNYMELKFFLEELFGRKIDLVTPMALKKQLKEKIQQLLDL